jgi:hypothetical protein
LRSSEGEGAMFVAARAGDRLRQGGAMVKTFSTLLMFSMMACMTISGDDLSADELFLADPSSALEAPSEYGGPPQCGTSNTPPCPIALETEPKACGTDTTPPCFLVGARDALSRCGTISTPPCPGTTVPGLEGGVANCGTPTTPPCPLR